jgi:hypothetical protein
MDLTPNLQLPYLIAAQAQKHVTHNEAIRMLDALLQIGVASRVTTAPPTTPADGVRFILPTGATGAWAGAAGRIAAFQDGAWAFFTPREGWIAWVADEHQAVAFSSGAWTSLTGAFATLGINATADTTNRLSVSSAASLFNNAGSGHQIKINKAATATTASLLYQTAFSGRAEMGTTGDDDFHIKVSADGATWRDALLISAATGRATFPAGGVVTSTATTVTIAVPSQAPTIQAALDQLLSYRFESAAQGIVSVANGTYAITAPLACRHPQPGRIVMKAATAAILPAETDFTGTKATDEAMVRSKYKVVVDCQNCGGIVCADGEGIGLVQDIAFIRSGTTGAPVGISASRRSSITMDRCAVFGFATNISASETGQSTATASQIAFSAGAGVTTQLGGFVRLAASLVIASGGPGIDASHSQCVSDVGLRVKGSGGAGIALRNGSRALVTSGNLSGNGGPSVTLAGGCVFEGGTCTLAGGVGQNALTAQDSSTAILASIITTGDATQRGFNAQRASVLATSGTHTGVPVFSPTLGTTANNGAWTF